MSGHDRLTVSLGTRSYDILVGNDLINATNRYLSPLLKVPRVLVVTDETVADLHLPTLAHALDDGGIDHQSFILPVGEASKSFAQIERLAELLLEARVERNTAIVALGGGVVGDIAGFAASILLRGVPFVQIPTTLLAQVDSSVGGKTGINTRHGKNLVGSFYQPLLVLADTNVLATLPRRHRLAGYAEVVKYGLIQDAGFFTWLETQGSGLIEGDRDALRHAILTSCSIKAQVVAADERETGARALLNLGHTFGHALEAEVGYGDELLHGEAVAIGITLAFDLSAQLGLCPAADADRVRRHLAAIGLPTGLDQIPGRRFAVDALLDHMSRDKKVDAGRIIFILTRGIGKAFVSDQVEISDVAMLLTRAVAA